MAITVEQMTAQIEKIQELRMKESQAKGVRDTITEEVEKAEEEMLQMLEESNLTQFRGPNGMVSISYRTSVKTPKSPEDREAFFQHLKEENLYDNMISVNSQTLNSYYKSKLEEAKTQGKSDFQIPGITEVTMNPILSLRK